MKNDRTSTNWKGRTATTPDPGNPGSRRKPRPWLATWLSIRAASALALFACAQPACAISVTINQDDATRLDFTVQWLAVGPGNSDQYGTAVGPERWIIALDAQFDYRVLVDIGPAAAGFGLGSPDGFEFLLYLGADRTFASSILVPGIDPPDFVHALPANPYGARFIYGPDISTPVPDGGATLLFLAGGVGTFTAARRRFRRAMASVSVATLALVLGPSAQAITITGGIGLLTSTGGAQLESWLGEGPLALTSLFSHQVGDGKNSLDFHAAVDGQGRTFVILEALTAGGQPANEIIGGYNPLSWHSSPIGYNLTPTLADRTAAIFNLTDAVWRPQNTDASGIFQTYHAGNYGPQFGGGPDLYVNSSLSSGTVNRFSYGLSGGNILGGLTAQGVTFGRMEVFSIAAAPVPDSGSMVMLLVCAFVGLVWLGETRRTCAGCRS